MGRKKKPRPNVSHPPHILQSAPSNSSVKENVVAKPDSLSAPPPVENSSATDAGDLASSARVDPGPAPLVDSASTAVAAADLGLISAARVVTSTPPVASDSAVSPLVAVASVSSSIPGVIPSVAAPSFAQRFKASLRNLRRISSPVFLEDGTPVVQAPASVLLKTADQWKGHIVARFHGIIPPPAKIYSDLNPAWGKFGNIVIRTVSDTSCLIMIPCASTRDWVLRVGYWQAGNCAFSVYPWSEDGAFDIQDLETAPTWAVLKNVPPQMYSLDDISVIASAIGEPLHTEKSRLDPFHFGDTKVKVEIALDAAPPTTIIVKDTQQNSVKVFVSYPRLPPKCCNCGRFGHLLNRCPKPLMKKKHGGFVPSGSAIAKTDISLSGGQVSSPVVAAVGKMVESPTMNKNQTQGSLVHTNHQRGSNKHSRVRGRSSPPVEEIVRHQRDPLMSEKTQESVKEWIKERKERTLAEKLITEIPDKAVLIEPETVWTLVRNKRDNTRQIKNGEVKLSAQVYDKSKKGKEKPFTQGMYSGSKLAKYAVSKSSIKAVQSKGTITSSASIDSQYNRGVPSITSAIL